METLNSIIKMSHLEKSLKTGIKILRNCLVGVGIYSLALAGSQGIHQELSPKIENQVSLKKILEKERKQAGIKEDEIIHVTISKNEKESSYSIKISEKEYEIFLFNYGRNLGVLRHELYHIADGHCDKPYNFLKYFFIQEPKATIYQITGLKL